MATGMLEYLPGGVVWVDGQVFPPFHIASYTNFNVYIINKNTVNTKEGSSHSNIK